MSARYQDRIERLKRLEQLIPLTQQSTLHDYPDSSQLLRQFNHANTSINATPIGQRTLQRDLKELIQDGRIVIVNPGVRPARYRRIIEDSDDDPLVLEYTRQQIEQIVAEIVPQRRLDALWQQLLQRHTFPTLNEQCFRILPDTIRLIPAQIFTHVLRDVISALVHNRSLQVVYQNNVGQRSEPLLHPQALIQRGPISYLLALKNDEPEPVRFYALHRIIRIGITNQPARAAEHFTLDEAITTGKLDFSCGTMIRLELRVRGYLDLVLRDCPLANNQHMTDEPENSEFLSRLTVNLPSSGALLRWLLGAGDNIEVLAPDDLRRIMARQANKMLALYAHDP
jgi:predicted DNA-binding transcriptional regulator YafY